MCAATATARLAIGRVVRWRGCGSLHPGHAPVLRCEGITVGVDKAHAVFCPHHALCRHVVISCRANTDTVHADGMGGEEIPHDCLLPLLHSSQQ